MSQNGKRAHSKGMSTSLAAVLAAVAAARTVGCSVGFIADRCCALPVSVARISPIVTCCQRVSETELAAIAVGSRFWGVEWHVALTTWYGARCTEPTRASRCIVAEPEDGATVNSSSLSRAKAAAAVRRRSGIEKVYVASAAPGLSAREEPAEEQR